MKPNLGDIVAKLSWEQFYHSETKAGAFEQFMDQVCSQCKPNQSPKDCIGRCFKAAFIRQKVLLAFAMMN